MGRFQFLTQKKFYINLLAAILLIFVLLWLTFRVLDSYTRHGKTFFMPDLVGMNVDEAKAKYGDQLHLMVIDSIYQKDRELGSIVQQDPLADSKIKKGRNVYCVIVAKTPEKTTMPNLNNISLRQAVVSLETAGLRVNEIVYVKHFARNAVCEQRYNGVVVKPGTELIKDSKITLYVGLGPDEKSVLLPDILGSNAEDVQRTLNIAGLNLGKEYFVDDDSLKNLVVVKMNPLYHSEKAEPGTFVDVWYGSAKKLDAKKGREELLNEDLQTFNESNEFSLDESDENNANDETADYEDVF